MLESREAITPIPSIVPAPLPASFALRNQKIIQPKSLKISEYLVACGGGTS